MGRRGALDRVLGVRVVLSRIVLGDHDRRSEAKDVSDSAAADLGENADAPADLEAPLSGLEVLGRARVIAEILVRLLVPPAPAVRRRVRAIYSEHSEVVRVGVGHPSDSRHINVPFETQPRASIQRYAAARAR